MKVKYICTFWGSENLEINDFVEKAMQAGYDGVELNVPNDESFVSALKAALKKHDAAFVAQQWLPPAKESVEEYRERMLTYLQHLASLNPLFINSHTGKDYYSFEDNCSLIESCNTIEEESGVSIVHETHRGRFPFQAAACIPYFERFPQLKLNADMSHFTNVSESLLEDQEDNVNHIIAHTQYIHARVGHDQSAQVNDPFAPEWSEHLARFTAWWQSIINKAKAEGKDTFYICPEFGPQPYIQVLPYSQKPTVDQWDINKKMMEHLKNSIAL